MLTAKQLADAAADQTAKHSARDLPSRPEHQPAGECTAGRTDAGAGGPAGVGTGCVGQRGGDAARSQRPRYDPIMPIELPAAVVDVICDVADANTCGPIVRPSQAAPARRWRLLVAMRT